MEYEQERLKLTISRHCAYQIPESTAAESDYSSFTKDAYAHIRVRLSAFRYCSKLKSMYIFSVSITDRESEVYFNDCLQELSMSGALLEHIITDDILSAVPVAVKKLSIQQTVLRREVANARIDSICRLTDLTELHLYAIDIRELHRLLIPKDSCPSLTIPQGISALTSLKRLTIELCNVAALPDSFYTLTQIRHLILSHNQLSDSTILEKMCTMSSLIYILLRSNSIEGQLPSPSRLSTLSSLKYLCLDGNNLTGELTDQQIDSLPTTAIISVNRNSEIAVRVNSKYRDRVRADQCKR